VLQSPASLLVNADVDAAAGIAWSKIAPSYFGSRVKVVGRDAATIQGCIDLCTDADGEHPYTVLIPPIANSYAESLTLKGSVSLVGLTTPLNADAVQITGAHTFTPASAQANTNRINFQNLTFISSGTSSNTITCSSSTKYFSKLTFSGCIFSGNKADTYSHLRTDDNVSVYVDNCRFESSAGGSASAGITQGNGPLYLSNNVLFDVFGRAIDVPVSTTLTKTATSTTGSLTLTVSDTTGLSVGQKISGTGLYSTTTIVAIVSGIVTMSSPPQTPAASFTATFGQTPYVEIHDSVLSGKGTEVVRLGNGLLTCNGSNFTNAASGSGINMLTGYAAAVGDIPAKSSTVGLVNSSFTIWNTSAYTITGDATPVFAALNGISYSNGIPGVSFSKEIGANVTVYDYTARATSIENGGTGATTRQAALNALAGAVTNLRVLAGDGTNITLRALAAADIPSLDTGKLTTGTLPVVRGGTGTTAGIANINTTQIAALTTAKTANLIPQLTTSGLISLTQLSGIGTTQIAALTTAQTANLIPQLTTSGLLSLAQMPVIPAANGGTGTTAGITAIATTQLGCLTTAQVANLVPQLNSSGQIYTTQIATLNQNTTGTAANVTGIVAAANGGTGTTVGITNINTTQIASLTTAQTANFIPKLTTGGIISLAQLSAIGTSQLGCLATTAISSFVPQLNASGQIYTTQIATLNQNTSGTAANLSGTQTAATVYAAPAASAGTAQFRALVAGDIPGLDAAKITSGILPAARGGTGYYYPNIQALSNVAGVHNIPAGTPYSMPYDESYIIWVSGAGATVITLFDLTSAPYNQGCTFKIINKSTGTVTVKLFNGTTLCTIATLNCREFIIGVDTTNTAANVAFLPSQTTTV
jgi:hypothetical protein